MQFADLMRLFREGQNEGRKRGYVSQGACDAEGIAAVVCELMEHFVTGASTYAWAADDLHAEFMRILGAAGDEAAGSTPEGVVVPCSAEGEPPASPAAAPAPAVCVWTPQDEGPAHEIWKTGCGTMYERAKSTGWCNKCKAPIKFTEAKT